MLFGASGGVLSIRAKGMRWWWWSVVVLGRKSWKYWPFPGFDGFNGGDASVFRLWLVADVCETDFHSTHPDQRCNAKGPTAHTAGRLCEERSGEGWSGRGAEWKKGAENLA